VCMCSVSLCRSLCHTLIIQPSTHLPAGRPRRFPHAHLPPPPHPHHVLRLLTADQMACREPIHCTSPSNNKQAVAKHLLRKGADLKCECQVRSRP
jgi:hypothetical protein